MTFPEDFYVNLKQESKQVLLDLINRDNGLTDTDQMLTAENTTFVAFGVLSDAGSKDHPNTWVDVECEALGTGTVRLHYSRIDAGPAFAYDMLLQYNVHRFLGDVRQPAILREALSRLTQFTVSEIDLPDNTTVDILVQSEYVHTVEAQMGEQSPLFYGKAALNFHPNIAPALWPSGRQPNDIVFDITFDLEDRPSWQVPDWRLSPDTSHALYLQVSVPNDMETSTRIAVAMSLTSLDPVIWTIEGDSEMAGKLDRLPLSANEVNWDGRVTEFAIFEVAPLPAGHHILTFKASWSLRPDFDLATVPTSGIHVLSKMRYRTVKSHGLLEDGGVVPLTSRDGATIILELDRVLPKVGNINFRLEPLTPEFNEGTSSIPFRLVFESDNPLNETLYFTYRIPGNGNMRVPWGSNTNIGFGVLSSWGNSRIYAGSGGSNGPHTYNMTLYWYGSELDDTVDISFEHPDTKEMVTTRSPIRSKPPARIRRNGDVTVTPSERTGFLYGDYPGHTNPAWAANPVTLEVTIPLIVDADAPVSGDDVYMMLQLPGNRYSDRLPWEVVSLPSGVTLATSYGTGVLKFDDSVRGRSFDIVYRTTVDQEPSWYDYLDDFTYTLRVGATIYNAGWHETRIDEAVTFNMVHAEVDAIPPTIGALTFEPSFGKRYEDEAEYAANPQSMVMTVPITLDFGAPLNDDSTMMIEVPGRLIESEMPYGFSFDHTTGELKVTTYETFGRTYDLKIKFVIDEPQVLSEDNEGYATVYGAIEETAHAQLRFLLAGPPADPGITGDFMVSNVQMAARTTNFRTFNVIEDENAPKLEVERGAMASGDNNLIMAFKDTSSQEFGPTDGILIGELGMEIHTSYDGGDTWIIDPVPGYSMLGRNAVYYKGAFYVIAYMDRPIINRWEGVGLYRIDPADRKMVLVMDLADGHTLTRLCVGAGKLHFFQGREIISTVDGLTFERIQPLQSTGWSTTPMNGRIIDMFFVGTRMHLLYRKPNVNQYYFCVPVMGSTTTFTLYYVYTDDYMDFYPTTYGSLYSYDPELVRVGDHAMFVIGQTTTNQNQQRLGMVLVRELRDTAAGPWKQVLANTGMGVCRVTTTDTGVVITNVRNAEQRLLEEFNIEEPRRVAHSNDVVNGWQYWSFDNPLDDTPLPIEGLYTVEVDPEDYGPYTQPAIPPAPKEQMPWAHPTDHKASNSNLTAMDDEGFMFVTQTDKFLQIGPGWESGDGYAIFEPYREDNDYLANPSSAYKEYAATAMDPALPYRRDATRPVGLASGFIVQTADYMNRLGSTINWLAKVDSRTGVMTPLPHLPSLSRSDNLGSEAQVLDLVISADRSRLYVTGMFDLVNGQSNKGFVALNAETGALITDFEYEPATRRLADSGGYTYSAFRIFPLQDGRMVVHQTLPTKLYLLDANGALVSDMMTGRDSSGLWVHDLVVSPGHENDILVWMTNYDESAHQGRTVLWRFTNAGVRRAEWDGFEMRGPANARVARNITAHRVVRNVADTGWLMFREDTLAHSTAYGARLFELLDGAIDGTLAPIRMNFPGGFGDVHRVVTNGFVDYVFWTTKPPARDINPRNYKQFPIPRNVNRNYRLRPEQPGWTI